MMIISVIFCPCPIWSGAFLFLDFLEAVEVILWRELATGAAADLLRATVGAVSSRTALKSGQSAAVEAAD